MEKRWKAKPKDSGKSRKNKRLVAYAVFAFLLLALLAFVVFFNGQQRQQEIPEGAECASDSGCLKVQTTCCSCNGGGEEVCAPESKAEELKAKNCEGRQICIALYNCKIKTCECNKGKCGAVPLEE